MRAFPSRERMRSLTSANSRFPHEPLKSQMANGKWEMAARHGFEPCFTVFSSLLIVAFCYSYPVLPLPRYANECKDYFAIRCNREQEKVCGSVSKPCPVR